MDSWDKQLEVGCRVAKGGSGGQERAKENFGFGIKAMGHAIPRRLSMSIGLFGQMSMISNVVCEIRAQLWATRLRSAHAVIEGHDT